MKDASYVNPLYKGAMMERERGEVIVEVRIWIPWAKHGQGELYMYKEMLSRLRSEDFLRPLPKNREISRYALLETEQLLEKRKLIIQQISTHVAASLVHAISEQDTVDGYIKEELRGNSTS
jgi:hypothetical protein